MNKGLVVYRSKYGATKRYAEWFARQMGYDLVENKGLGAAAFAAYDTVVFFCAIYASGMSGVNTLRKHWPVLGKKRLAIFCVGASPYDAQAFNAIKQQNLKGALKDVPVFYGRGAWNEAALSFADRTLCRMLMKSVAKKNPAELAPWEQALMEAQGRHCDWTDARHLEPLVEFIQEP